MKPPRATPVARGSELRARGGFCGLPLETGVLGPSLEGILERPAVRRDRPVQVPDATQRDPQEEAAARAPTRPLEGAQLPGQDDRVQEQGRREE